MPNDYFQFKQFTVWQNRCAMKVGTDGVLLGAWAEIKNAQNILDIGTGTGLIALMMAQRSSARIDAIEIDPNAALQARENVQKSPWNNRIFVYNSSLQEFKNIRRHYDIILTNPPYFTGSLMNPDLKRSTARHDLQFSKELLIEGVRKLLDSRGFFNIILPTEEFISFSKSLKKYNLYLSRQTNVYSKPGSPCIRVLAEFSIIGNTKLTSDLIIETNSRHKYSVQYMELTKDYYLKF